VNEGFAGIIVTMPSEEEMRQNLVIFKLYNHSNVRLSALKTGCPKFFFKFSVLSYPAFTIAIARDVPMADGTVRLTALNDVGFQLLRIKEGDEIRPKLTIGRW